MLKGSLVALATPFDDDNRVDYPSLKGLIEFHVEAGSNGLVIAGTTGESATLSRDEHIELIERSVELAAGRLPIIAGTGSNSTSQTIDLSRAVDHLDIAGYLIVVPYYNKPMQAGMVAHFEAVADAVTKPVMLYNVPGRTVADMLPETVAKLAEHDNIFAIKEATGSMDRLREIRERVCDDFLLFSGDDFTLLSFIELGGHGVVTVSGNVAPDQVAQLCEFALNGKSEDAAALDETLQPLNTALFIESNPIPVKWALAEMGLIGPGLRLPLTPYDKKYHAGMRAALKHAGVELDDAI